MEQADDFINEHPKTTIFMVMVISFVIIWMAWCYIPEQIRNNCDTCNECPTCFLNPYDEQCYGYCIEAYHECVKEDGACICQEQY